MQTSDYYAVLGISPTAPAAEVKSAYHRAAKKAHPDAGGSTVQMQRVNEAYQVLSDPLARRDYDARRGTATAHRPAGKSHATAHHSATHATAHSATHGRAEAQHTPPHTQPQETPRPRPVHTSPPAQHYTTRQAYSQVRFLAAERLKAWVPLSVVSYLVTPRLAPLVDQPGIRLLLLAISFVPVFGFILCLVFLISPEVRLNLYRSVHPRATNANREDYLVTLGVVASFILFSGAWLLINV